LSDTPAVLADGATLDGPTLDRAAAWLAAMDAEYYGLFDLPSTRVEAILAGCLRDPSSEFGTAAFLLHDGVAEGLLCAFPAEEMFGRRMQVLRALLAAAPDPTAARRLLRAFDGAGRWLPPDGFYLAKLFLAPALRGGGWAGRLLDGFLGQARKLGRQPCLHVRRDNAVALSLYRRHGFVDAADPAASSAAYGLMVAERGTDGTA
jgi:GNAT superfamily N-acetyltransferase